MRKLLRKPAIRAFTFAELMIGLAITSIVMGALAAVCVAVSISWRHGETTTRTSVTGTQAAARIESLLSSARAIGRVQAGTLNSPTATGAASILFWRQDDGDQVIEFEELGLIEHDVTSRTLKYYYVQWPANWSQTAINNANFAADYGDLVSQTAASDFKALANVTSVVLARDVTGALVAATDIAAEEQSTHVEFVFRTVQDGQEMTRYVSASLRSVITERIREWQEGT